MLSTSEIPRILNAAATRCREHAPWIRRQLIELFTRYLPDRLEKFQRYSDQDVTAAFACVVGHGRKYARLADTSLTEDGDDLPLSLEGPLQCITEPLQLFGA